MKKNAVLPTCPRHIAIKTLLQWEQSGKPVDSILNPALARLASADRSLARNIVYGIMRTRGHLDYLIASFSSTPLPKLKPLVLQALRVGSFQLASLEKIPPSAAINTTVTALKREKAAKWLYGFVNGVLRNMERKRSQWVDISSLDSLHPARTNHPDWLVQRWLARYGQETTEAICAANNQEAELCLRLFPDQDRFLQAKADIEAAGIQTRCAQYTPQGLILPAYRGDVRALPGLSTGEVQIQDQAAQVASYLVGPFTRPMRILDACAGLGGKTTHLAQLMSPGSICQAVEPDTRRFSLLKENLTRLHLDEQVSIWQSNLQDFAAQTQQRGESYDRILLDVPCSGTGVIRRKPDIRWNRRETDLQAYQENQLFLLKTAASILSPNGILIYATCSMEPEENQQVVDSFLTGHPAFTCSDTQEIRKIVPVSAASLINDKGFFQSIPSQGLDGFFAVRLCRRPQAL